MSSRLILKLNLQYFGHLKGRVDKLEKTLLLGNIEGRRRREWQRTRCLESITNSMDMSLSKLCKMVKDGEAWHAAVHGVTKSCIGLSDWTTMSSMKCFRSFKKWITYLNNLQSCHLLKFWICLVLSWIWMCVSYMYAYVPSFVTQWCPTLGDTIDCSLPGSSVHGNSLGKNTRIGCRFLLQGIFPG